MTSLNYILLLSFSIILSLLFSPTSTSASTIGIPTNFLALNSGLVGYWTFDGKDVVNGVALDKSGNGNHGNLVNIATSTFYAPGKIGQGFRFDGVNDWVSYPTISHGTVNSFAVWVYQKKASNGIIMDNASNFGKALRLNTNATNLWYQCDSGVNANVNVTALSGVWWHYAVVRNDTAVSFYRNGLQIGTTQTLSSNDTLSTRGMGGLGSVIYSGSIDDLRAYNRALSAQEVAQLYSMGAATKVDVSPTSSSSPLTNGLVGYWTFDGKDVVNGVALDKSGNGNHGNLVNIATSTFYAPGNIGQGFRFDGVNDYVYLGTSVNSYLASTSAFTISAWFKAENVNGGYQNIICSGVFPSRTCIGIGSTPSLSTAIYNGASFSGKATLGASNPKNNLWYHIVMINNTQSITAYLSGVALTSTGVDISTGGNGTAIGSRTDGSASFFRGLIDDVRIYNRALSPQEVAQLYSMGAATKVDVSPTSSSSPLTNGLVGYWTFDGKDVVNGVALDKSGNGNHGNLVNIATSTFYAPGKIGQGFRFDGVDDYVTRTTISVSTVGTATFSYWIKSSADNNGKYIMSAGLAGGAWQRAQTFDSSNHIGFYSGLAYVYGTKVLTDGKWHHVVISDTKPLGRERVQYVDGAIDISATALSGSNYGSDAINFNELGSYNAGLFYSGLIDDVRIYNRALSPQEIQQLYMLGR